MSRCALDPPANSRLAIAELAELRQPDHAMLALPRAPRPPPSRRVENVSL